MDYPITPTLAHDWAHGPRGTREYFKARSGERTCHETLPGYPGRIFVLQATSPLRVSFSGARTISWKLVAVRDVPPPTAPINGEKPGRKAGIQQVNIAEYV